MIVRFINSLMGAVKHYTAIDFAIFKIYLFAAGILFGVYFAKFFLQYINVVWIIAIVACIIVLVQLFRYAQKK